MLRDDDVKDVNSREQILKSAPISKYGYFVVPKVIE
jgi:aspartyl/glutamyl-tRNA(Asn/Gln) amidotransferase C subunit